MNENAGDIDRLRLEYHQALLSSVWGWATARGGRRFPSNADGSSSASVRIAEHMLLQYAATEHPIRDQGAGSTFTQATARFIKAGFAILEHLRPGQWVYGVDEGKGITDFEQYRYLGALDRFLKLHRDDLDLQAAFRSDYRIKPDITIGRLPVDDTDINRHTTVVTAESSTARRTPLRRRNGDGAPILHASISCKWTIRSDRSQNIRTEALNLIRNRKGGVPRIIAVTGEPLPSRLASVAQGTGDIDCVYHMALPELLDAVRETNQTQQIETLEMLVTGNRLRDIGDLPFDLAI